MKNVKYTMHFRVECYIDAETDEKDNESNCSISLNSSSLCFSEERMRRIARNSNDNDFKEEISTKANDAKKWMKIFGLGEN